MGAPARTGQTPGIPAVPHGARPADAGRRAAYAQAMDMRPRHADRIAALRRAILETPGATPPAARIAAETPALETGPADGYLHKVRHESYRIVDEDLAALRAAGLEEDAIFELTLATALGEATRRLRQGTAALARAKPEV